MSFYNNYIVNNKSGEEMSRELENQLVQAMFQLKKSMNKGLGRDVDTVNITMSEYILMREVAGNTREKYNCNALTEVKEYLSVSKAAVSQMLSSLEKRGYLTREVDESNRRNIIVVLTEEGRVVFEKKNEEFYQRFGRVIGRVGKENVAHFVEMINKMSGAMDDEVEIE